MEVNLSVGKVETTVEISEYGVGGVALGGADHSTLYVVTMGNRYDLAGMTVKQETKEGVTGLGATSEPTNCFDLDCAQLSAPDAPEPAAQKGEEAAKAPPK